MAAILQTPFSKHFPEWKCIKFVLKVPISIPEFGSDIGLAPTRRVIKHYVNQSFMT